jgi:hypothetical protein
MIQLSLTTQEATELREVLESFVSDLRMEIANTDLKDFRDQLKQRESILNKIIQDLQ